MKEMAGEGRQAVSTWTAAVAVVLAGDNEHDKGSGQRPEPLRCGIFRRECRQRPVKGQPRRKALRRADCQPGRVCE